MAITYRSPSLLRAVINPSSTLIWARGLNNAIGLVAVTASLAYITLSESVSILHLRPFPVALLCYLFLGEGFTRIQIIACGESSRRIRHQAER